MLIPAVLHLLCFRIRGLPISGLHDCILRAHNYGEQSWNSEIYTVDNTVSSNPTRLRDPACRVLESKRPSVAQHFHCQVNLSHSFTCVWRPGTHRLARCNSVSASTPHTIFSYSINSPPARLDISTPPPRSLNSALSPTPPDHHATPQADNGETQEDKHGAEDY
jgi:hypothetical protein